MNDATRTDPATGERLVWDIFENAWVTEAYWRWVNGR